MPSWTDILNEIQTETQKHVESAQSALDIIRKRHLTALFGRTNRNIIAYYSGFLSKPNIEGIEISDEDKNGFMTAVHRLDKRQGLDLLLHTPGGSIAAAESIVDYLKQIFGKDIRAIVPQIAMSAGTMIACACKTILMGRQSNLGPVDPQFGNIPAAGVLEEFQKASDDINGDPNKAQIWQFIIGQYTPSFLGQCQNAVDWAKEFVQDALEDNMFSQYQDKTQRASQVVHKLTDFSGTKAHNRHIHYHECRSIGLKIELLEDDQVLQDLVLTVHHCYMHALMNSSAYKIIENHLGVTMVKQQQIT
jgi:ClpP class serine protease